MMGKFAEQVNTVRNNQALSVHPCCYGYGYINKGDVAVVVNQTRLLPAPAPGLSGESYFYIDFDKDLYSEKQFLITFDAGGANPYVEIHQYHKS